MAQHSIDIDINLNDILKNTDKRIKGYAFDSLVFRYKMAREAQADFEFAKAQQQGQASRLDWSHYQKQANRDLLRFIEILNDVIGEHD